MIIVYHKNNKITRVISEKNEEIAFDGKNSIAFGLMQLAGQFPEAKLIWCNEDCQHLLNLKDIEIIFHHNKLMLSYSRSRENYLGRKIGYVEDSPFINVNRQVTYPTWQMGTDAGIIHSAVLLETKGKIKPDNDFGYYLNSVAKVCMPLGLFCYSEPKLLLNAAIGGESKISTFTFFKFVKQHYKNRWLFLLFLDMMLYERKFPLLAFLYAIFFKNRSGNNVDLDAIRVNPPFGLTDKETIDVIIPTIGRKQYLYDVLKDLAIQTHLPENVIIVEQNPIPGSSSELDYLQDEAWPFIIKHTFTNQAGACNARNIALNEVESGWIFFADDDIRIENSFLEKGLTNCMAFGITSSIFSCLLEGEKNEYKNISQTTIFGSGCSIVKKSVLGAIKFNTSFEFGYGEDSDFGMQLRNSGSDVIYFPEPAILHLKAPVGGFRRKPSFAWSDEATQPKPSPMIMLLKEKYDTKEQILGYKLVLFFKLLKEERLVNAIRFLFLFQKKWDSSLLWSKQLDNNENK